MIKDNLNSLIMNAMKAGDKVRTNAFKAVKTAFMQWETSRDNVGKSLTEDVEINVIRKLVSQYKDTAEQCNDGKHDDIVQEALNISNVLEELLPAPVTTEMIETEFNKITTGGNAIEPIQKNMGQIINKIKSNLTGADGKTVSQFVKSHLK